MFKCAVFHLDKTLKVGLTGAFFSDLGQICLKEGSRRISQALEQKDYSLLVCLAVKLLQEVANSSIVDTIT